LILLSAFISGCYVVDFLTPEGSPTDQQLLGNYESVELMISNAADVLATINLPEYELLSQSTSVIASAGEKKKGYKQWVNMVAFDEDFLTANRKYLFIADEKPKALFAKPWERMTLDCQMVLDEEILKKPYANENEYRIGTLEQISNQFTNDAKEVSSDNEVIYTSQILVNQAFSTIMQVLQDSPAQASLLSTSEGMKFEHSSFDKGRIRMIINQNIATIELQAGSVLKKRIEVTDKVLEYKSGNE
jgi:hypothetical protein